MEINCLYCHQLTTIEIFKEEGLSQELITECENCAHQLFVSAEWNDEEGEFDLFVDKK